ncbi:MAG: hypothetical protein QM820_41370 [Minicystis sp.]
MRALLATLALAAAGCQAQAFIASPSDYAGYRATRVAPTFEERLAAAERYLQQHPDGRFKDEVRAFFDRGEEAFYAANQGNKAGLQGYLKVLPRGPHHAQAERRIGEIETAERSSRAELNRSVAEVEARVSGRAAAERAHVREELEAWLRRLLDPQTYAAPVAAARADLVVPLSLSLPSPRCERIEPAEGAVARRCAKLIELPYRVEVERGTEPREATIEITIAEDARGVPLEASIGGPDFFLRLEETYRVKPIAPGDTAQRTAAITRAASLVKAAFGAVVSEDPSCKRRPSPPAVLDLACAGVRVTVSAAAAPGEDDRILIRPLP